MKLGRIEVLRFLVIVFCVTLCISDVNGQNFTSTQKSWSQDDKLSEDDYFIKIEDEKLDPIFSQFRIGYSANGLDFLNRNFNKNVTNIFDCNSSWIDTTSTVNLSSALEYQQLFFDLSEVHVRSFRKKLLQEKKQLIKGLSIVDEINNEISSNFSKERLLIAQETKHGTDKKQLKKWKDRISNLLEELHEFRYENSKKIKLQKPE